MINAKDLMIGNFVYFGVNIVPIKSIHTESVLKDTITVYIELNKKLNHYCVDISEIKPIALSEKILLKCGFEKDNMSGWGGWLSPRFHLGSQRRIIMVKDGVYKILERELLYLHELQNLFYLLTKQELEIKL